MIDGVCYNSCIYMAVWADGKHIKTVEGPLGPERFTQEMNSDVCFQAICADAQDMKT